MLTITRPDISSEEITEYPATTRFIKLPITQYLELLGIRETTNRAQIALINAINSPNYRFVCAALARRLGKTYIANVIAQLVALVPNCNVLIISPNYNLSSISFELQRQLIKKFNLEVERDNLKDKVIELANGSTIRMGSLSTVDSVVGRSYQLILFDEAALGTDGEEAFNVQLRPTLDRMNSKAIFISTPRGKRNWFSRFYDRGSDPLFPEWCSITADYKENPRMMEADVEEAKRSMSKAEFEQEYLASFTTFAGQVFDFSRENVVDYLPKDGVEFIAGLDVGYKHPTALCIIAYYEEDGVDYYHIVDEYMDTATTDVHASAIKNLIEKWGVETVFIDSAAAQFGADLTFTYDISTTKAKKDKLAGIGFLQAVVETDRLKVSEHCENTLAALDQYRWDDNAVKENTLHDYSDMMDAIRYGIYTFKV